MNDFKIFPWSIKEFNEVHSAWCKILRKPKDDWDLTRDQISAGGHDPEDTRVSEMDPFHPATQVHSVILKKYPDKKLAKSHSVRFFKIIMFLRKYKNDLMKEGFVQEKPHIDYFKNELLEGLCVLPYSQKEEFSYQEIVDKAWELIKEGTAREKINRK